LHAQPINRRPAGTMMPHPRQRSTRQAQAGLYYVAGTVSRANPIVAAYRWRYELAGPALLVAVWMALGWEWAAAAAILAAWLAGMAACSPRGRRLLAERAWCIITPHRVRAGCAQAWIHSRNGKIPAVLLTTQQPFGERVYLWCRAGTTAGDFIAERELLAAACWAKEIRAARHPRYAHLVALDVIRRPLPDAPEDAAGVGRADAA
jgi:hypothetical protein